MFFRLPGTLCLFLFACAAVAQRPADFRVQQYGTEDGLPSNGIKGLQWDKSTGFLWIATEAGVVRFNGMGFKTFTSDDNPRITNERTLFLARNNAGLIYTADNTGNIFRVEKNALRFLDRKNIAGNQASNIFTINISDQLFNAGHTISNGPFSLQFDTMLPESDTSCYIRHNGRLFYFSISMRIPVPIERTGNVTNLFRSENGLFFIENGKSAFRIEKKTRKIIPADIRFPPGTTAPDYSTTPFLWENGMHNPVLIVKENAWEITATESVLIARLICNQVPPDELIRYLQYDAETGTLFIGTDSKGIIVLRKNKVLPMRKERSSPNERTSYYSQFVLPGGNVLTNEGHIIGENPERDRAPFPGAFSNNTLLQGDSLFWIIKTTADKQFSCLHRYDLKTGVLTTYPKVRQIITQFAMAVSGNRLYLASDSGIYRLEADSLRLLYTYPRPDRLRIHFDMKEYRPGELLLANCNALLSYSISSGKMDTIFSPGNYCVRSTWTYKDYIFFGTYGNGLYISKNGKVKPLPLDKNKHLLFTHCFIDDGSGYCWISTNRGLFKASVSDMINAYENNIPQVYYHYFGRNDGMDMTEMNGGCMPCGVTLPDKTISFPTMEGLLWVNPESSRPQLPDGEIFLDEFIVDNIRRDPARTDQEPLSAKAHDILIRVGFSAWCNKENVYLQYQLNGDGEWKEVNTDNGAVIQFNNLKQGDYHLRIRKLNGFGTGNYSYKEVRFSIPTPWHERWWFYGLCGAALFGVLALYFRYRTRQYQVRQRKLEQQVAEKTRALKEQNEQLEKNNSIKTRLISIISHDIITPLKFVTVAGKNLLEKRKLMPEALQQETIREMTNTSQELQLLSTNILNWIKYQNENRRMGKETFNLYEMVSQVLGILQSLARQKNLVIINRVEPGLEIHQYYEPLKILVYNLLTNAIQFTEKGSITVSAVPAGELLTVAVADEGTGMTPEQIQRLLAEDVVITSANVDNKRGHGLGYLIIKDLLKTINAGLDIESEKGKGTTVSISFPYSRNGGS